MPKILPQKMNKQEVGDDLSVCILNIFWNELYPSSIRAVSENLFWKVLNEHAKKLWLVPQKTLMRKRKRKATTQAIVKLFALHANAVKSSRCKSSSLFDFFLSSSHLKASKNVVILCSFLFFCYFWNDLFYHSLDMSLLQSEWCLCWVLH